MTISTRHFDPNIHSRVMPMRPESTEFAARLEHAMHRGFTAVVDPAHRDFYSVVIDGVAYYFHVFEDHGTAYLVAVNETSEETPHSVSASAHLTTH